jgi:hypothetical protein
MSAVNEFLQSVGLTAHDLDRPGHLGEMDELRKQIDLIEQSSVTIEKLKEYITKSKNVIVSELVAIDVPIGNWLTALCFFLPLVGIIRKWYQDQKRVKLEIKLDVYSKIEDLLLAPDRRRMALREKLLTIKKMSG